MMNRCRTPSTAVGPPGAAAGAVRAQLVAVQARWTLAHYRDEDAFAAYVEALLEQVEARRESGAACLVAFPEFIGLPLIFAGHLELLQGCTRWVEAGGRLIREHESEVAENCRRFGVSPVRGLLLARSEAIRSSYVNTFSRAAARHRCYLAAGSVPLPDTGEGGLSGAVYNTAFFFGPDGAVLGTQRKVHPYGAEGTPEGLDLTPGPLSEVRTFATELGKVGIAVCYDAWQEAVMEALAAQGAGILVQPSANAHPWDEWQRGDWKTGLWQQVQRHVPFQYGINPMMVGWLFAPDDEYACDGQSTILAKVAGTPDGSGYLARAPAPAEGEDAAEAVIVSTVPLPGRP